MKVVRTTSCNQSNSKISDNPPSYPIRVQISPRPTSQSEPLRAISVDIFVLYEPRNQLILNGPISPSQSPMEPQAPGAGLQEPKETRALQLEKICSCLSFTCCVCCGLGCVLSGPVLGYFLYSHKGP